MPPDNHRTTTGCWQIRVSSRLRLILKMSIIDIQDPADRSNLDKFFAVAAGVYKNDPVWVSESKESFQQRYTRSKLKGNVSMFPVVALEDGFPQPGELLSCPTGQ